MAVRVTIDNSYSHISGLNAKQEKSLKAELSYVVGGKSGYFSKYGPKKRSLLGKKGDFPSGLVYRVMAWLYNEGISYDTKDLRVKP